MDCGVKLLEQPFKRGNEAALDGLRLPLPVAADESCLDLAELETLPGRFDVVNIKLDKCGGLTEGLMIAERAQALGLKVMVGNMLGTSLSVAPQFLLGQLCDVVDLDGPLFITQDRESAMVFEERQGLLTAVRLGLLAARFTIPHQDDHHQRETSHQGRNGAGRGLPEVTTAP